MGKKSLVDIELEMDALYKREFESLSDEFDKALVDAALYGYGWLKIRRNNSFVHVPHDKVKQVAENE